jgi:hypothetical protein
MKLLVRLFNIQLKFRIKHQQGKGSALRIFLFDDDLLNENSKDRSFVGLKQDFTGLEIMVLTPPKELIESKTWFF